MGPQLYSPPEEGPIPLHSKDSGPKLSPTSVMWSVRVCEGPGVNIDDKLLCCWMWILILIMMTEPIFVTELNSMVRHGIVNLKFGKWQSLGRAKLIRQF